MTDRRNALRDWLASEPPENIDDLLEDLRRARRLFLEECADRLQTPLNEQLQRMPCSSYADRLRIVERVRNCLTPLDLCVDSPDSHEPSMLIGNNMGSKGTFQLRLLRRRGASEQVFKSSAALPLLTLRPAPPREPSPSPSPAKDEAKRDR